ncbi:hypothetical protein GCM10010276_86960 [Streptomyces longisporus]|uniref:Transposase n=1 Tax=Streptomyces longisporus TaxID=1948 RepID=A0ABP6ATQ6_STRLO
MGIEVGRSQVRRILLAEGVRWRRSRSWTRSKDADFEGKGHGSSSSTLSEYRRRFSVDARGFTSRPRAPALPTRNLEEGVAASDLSLLFTAPLLSSQLSECLGIRDVCRHL